MKRVGIIGGGLGGLASACVLAARGYEVIVFERNDWLGGKAAVLEGQGFRFDMGPTILTLPSVLDRIFFEAGRDPASMLNLVRTRSSMALVFRRRLNARSGGRHIRDGRETLCLLSKNEVGRWIQEIYCALREAPSHFRQLLFLEVGGRPSGHVRRARNVPAWKSCRRAGYAARPFGRGSGARTYSGFARVPDGRSFHAVCGIGAQRLARRALRHRAHADARGCMVLDGWHPRHSGGACKLGEIAGRRIPDQCPAA